MDDDSKTQSFVKWALGAMGLGVLATAASTPKLGWWSLWIILAIIFLALVLFGGYYLWQRRRAKRQREQFTSAIEQQTAAPPRAISDPNKRASLDKVRQKFQTGLQEFKSRGKDIYKLPWYVIIGESGSGKTEAIRHSAIDFPPGMQDELQGSGGTVNMDWWFTNRGIILDTAGSMLFSETRAGEAPEWGEFLRLLKKSRPHCPINGLLLVLSIESLIKDSADRIAQKASTLAQQLDLIQRTLDVRFPVYLLVTKCDLLTGFREFFDNIDDPLLQHQMFGWSNPDPLDAPFRPDLVEQHLKVITAKIQRRRLALLRDATSAGQYGNTQSFYRAGTGGATKRRLDEVDAMHALPESIMRLAPRLRRYLETIFIAGEWSSKPVFLRGIYFTSSMREGKALDEAIAFATGLSLDQLPEDRSWEKNRAFFLRDLFHEKLFRESGLVTRATNTLKMLRQRQVLIFGSAGVALLILLTFAWFAHINLKNNIRKQAAYWRLGADNWSNGQWTSGSVVKPIEGVYSYAYCGTNVVDVPDKLTVVEYHKKLAEFAEKGLSVGWVFKPMSWFSKVRNLPEAQQALFEGGVLRPLVFETRKKMMNQPLDPQNSFAAARHQAALLALMQLEADSLSKDSMRGTNSSQKAERYLSAFLSYLTDTDQAADTNLISLFTRTYSAKREDARWPATSLLGGGSLTNNAAIRIGLDNFRMAHQVTVSNIWKEVAVLNELVSRLQTYRLAEEQWLASRSGACGSLKSDLLSAKDGVDAACKTLLSATNYSSVSVTNIEFRYRLLENAAHRGSVEAFQSIWSEVPGPLQSEGIFGEVKSQVSRFASAAAQTVKTNLDARSIEIRKLDADFVAPSDSMPIFERRWSLYTNACALSSFSVKVDENMIGNVWTNYDALADRITKYHGQLAAYKETLPFAGSVTNTCNQIAASAELSLKSTFVDSYAKVVADKLAELAGQSRWNVDTITNSENWLRMIESDLHSAPVDQKGKLTAVFGQLTNSVHAILTGIGNEIRDVTGFPVLLDSEHSMTIDDMRKLKELVNGLTRELQNSIWQIDGAGLASLRARCSKYVSIVNALMDDQGNPVNWQLKFLPQESNREIKNIYRDLKISFADAIPIWTDAAHNNARSVEGTTFQGLTLSFFKSRDDSSLGAKTNEFNPNWGLVRLIRDPKTERRDGGATWRFRINLVDGTINGDMVFEGSLVGQKGSLPETNIWRKQ